jgi:hypothetical protein
VPAPASGEIPDQAEVVARGERPSRRTSDGAAAPLKSGGLHETRSMRIVSHMNRLSFSEDSKKKLWRPCREARALGL